MNDKQENLLRGFIDNVIKQRKGLCSDDDIMDFCDENDIPHDKAFQFIDEARVPQCCEGCKYIGAYNNMYPCNCCSRPRKDMYERKKG